MGKALTELDLTVLAIVARKGPMSAYDVRKQFAISTTPSFSSSTGSVYPSVRRLVAARLLAAGETTGARKVQTLTATPAGRNAAIAWLSEFDTRLASATPDPIRTRSFSLILLDVQARHDFFVRAIAATDQAIATFEVEVAKERAMGLAEFEILAGLGALYELEARRNWLVRLKDAWSAAAQP